ncbi:hypothetical protein BDZ85DRAFT_44503 [Elsinoe ampelina]|uniref:Uncharacterized protein n=1 Tax=Elsinoe ampelina TaxID=302913 RepID=A0A6A6G1H9_9PEZI|nr:hypothetical protein BDZ85DRAFT_44503 [Elsinoe ampelina]
MNTSIRSQDSYSPQLVAECLLRHYELLASMAYFDKSKIKHPPPEGWSDKELHIDLLRHLDRSDAVIELLRRIPYIQDDMVEEWEVFFGAFSISYLQKSWRMWRINKEALAKKDWSEMGLAPFDATPPPEVITLTTGRYATFWCIDTKKGSIIPTDGYIESDAPDYDPWLGCKAVPIRPYFDEIYHKIRALEYVPQTHHEHEIEGTIGDGSQGEGLEIARLHQEHGWPNHFRREECIAAVQAFRVAELSNLQGPPSEDDDQEGEGDDIESVTET